MNRSDQTQNVDQAEQLKEMFNKINNNQPNDLDQQNNQDTPKIDVLNLPPRKEVHNNNQKHLHIKMSKPFLRLSFVVLLLLVIMIVAIFVGGIDFLDLFKLQLIR